MPVVFTFFFSVVAGGVALYWFVEQRLGDRPAVSDQLPDWPAEHPRRSAGGRAAESSAPAPARRKARATQEELTWQTRPQPIVEFLTGSQRPSASRRDCRVERPPTGRASTSPARRPSCWSGTAASRSRRCSTSSTWRSGATLADGQRVFVDALEYRKGKDIELRQMAKFLAEKAKQTGARSADRSAQPVRAAHRAPGGGGGSRRDDREHRRRVLEDRASSPLRK